MKISEVTNPHLHNPIQIVGVLVALGGFLLAILVGYWIGVWDTKLLFLFTGSIVFVVILTGLQQKAWVLIPLGWYLSGGLGFLRVPFSVREITIMLAFASFVALAIVSGRRSRIQWNSLDYFVWLNMVWVALTYLINPVGIRALGSENIGGRSYFVIFLAALSYVTIVRMPQSINAAARIPLLLVIGAGFVAILNGIAYAFPNTGPVLLQIYSNVDIVRYLATGISEPHILRLTQLAPFGGLLVLVLCGYYRATVLFNPLRWPFYGFCAGCLCILVSGFRSAFLWVFVGVGLSMILRRAYRDLVLTTIIGGIIVGGILLGQGRVYELPLSVQRTVSFLPAKWSPIVLKDTEDSTQGRFKWWKIVIDEGLIKNWWVGDGFGVNIRDYLLMGRSSDFMEDVFLTGAYHNGPLTTVRYAGIIGLVVVYGLMIAGAVKSVKALRMVEGTPLQPLAMYLAIVLIWYPFHFTFVFGSYDGTLPQLILWVAMLRLVIRLSEQHRSAPEPAVYPKRRLKPVATPARSAT
jgi:hypothetical protein